jgi:hypothetical protein
VPRSYSVHSFLITIVLSHFFTIKDAQSFLGGIVLSHSLLLQCSSFLIAIPRGAAQSFYKMIERGGQGTQSFCKMTERRRGRAGQLTAWLGRRAGGRQLGCGGA